MDLLAGLGGGGEKTGDIDAGSAFFIDGISGSLMLNNGLGGDADWLDPWVGLMWMQRGELTRHVSKYASRSQPQIDPVLGQRVRHSIHAI